MIYYQDKIYHTLRLACHEMGPQIIWHFLGSQLNKLSSQVEKEARDYFNEKVYTTVIPRNVRLSEAPSHGMPVLNYDKSCPGSRSYFNFTDEFINQETTIGSTA